MRPPHCSAGPRWPPPSPPLRPAGHREDEARGHHARVDPVARVRGSDGGVDIRPGRHCHRLRDRRGSLRRTGRFGHVRCRRPSRPQLRRLARRARSRHARERGPPRPDRAQHGCREQGGIRPGPASVRERPEDPDRGRLRSCRDRGRQGDALPRRGVRGTSSPSPTSRTRSTWPSTCRQTVPKCGGGSMPRPAPTTGGPSSGIPSGAKGWPSPGAWGPGSTSVAAFELSDQPAHGYAGIVLASATRPLSDPSAGPSGASAGGGRSSPRAHREAAQS